MSRETYVEARNKKTNQVLELYWTGADSAQVLAECFDRDEDEKWAGPSEKFYDYVKRGLNEQIRKCQEEVDDIENSVARLKELASNAKTVEVANNFYDEIVSFDRDLKDAKENAEHYKNVLKSLTVISGLSFLEPDYGEDECDWEVVVTYSY